ncbi:MAG: DNA/RNA non-specific endonuclease, partial [Candidatus Cryptobacteroides sp.]
NISQTGVTLSGSYSSVTGTVTEAGFEYGSVSGSYEHKVQSSTKAADFSCEISGLALGTTYYYRAYVLVSSEDNAEVREFSGSEKVFTLGSVIPAKLEAPATKSGYTYAGFGSGTSRNYNYCYDTSHYAALWVAYPLTNSHTQGSASSSSWRYDPNIESKYQPAITGNSYGTVYGNTNYSRGHQCPNASRQSDATMNSQTFYATNQTPQLQNKFNSGIWSNLENGIRALTETNKSDTLYVVTGPCYQTVGGSEEVSWLTAVSSSTVPSKVTLANYYWKAVLKIKTTNGYITDACAVGFWLEHKAYESSDYTPYIVSIDEIEAKTGFDLFAGMPDYLEAVVEAAKPSWDAFKSY